jgi:hypothetical protein
MAGKEIRTIVWLIDAISIPMVVLISPTHLDSSFTLRSRHVVEADHAHLIRDSNVVLGWIGLAARFVGHCPASCSTTGAKRSRWSSLTVM